MDQKISAWKQDHLPELEALGQQTEGWSWTCDASGRYTSCSPEVEQALGLPPLAFLKKPLAAAQLSRESVQVMHVALAAARQPEDLPVAVGVRFLDSEQQEVPATITIMAQSASSLQAGMRGFVQVMPAPRVGVIPVTGAEAAAVAVDQVLTATVLYQESDYLSASQNLHELLERLRHITPAILQAKESRLFSQSFVRYANEAEAVSHDPERLPLRPPGSAPRAESYSLEHQLEWGEKLEATEDEKAFIQKHRWANGLLAGFRIARAPDRILLVQKSWLHCALHIRPGDTGLLILQLQGEEIVIKNALDLLLTDAESLLPQLIQALSRPNSRTRWAERGIHYLRRPGA